MPERNGGTMNEGKSKSIRTKGFDTHSVDGDFECYITFKAGEKTIKEIKREATEFVRKLRRHREFAYCIEVKEKD